MYIYMLYKYNQIFPPKMKQYQYLLKQKLRYLKTFPH